MGRYPPNNCQISSPLMTWKWDESQNLTQEKMDYQDNKHRHSRLDETFGLEWNASLACWQLFDCTSPETESVQENRSISTNNPSSWIWHKNPSHVRPWCFPEMSTPLPRKPQETSSVDLLPSDLFITKKVLITQKNPTGFYFKRQKVTSDWLLKEPEGKSSSVNICSIDI